MVDESKQNNKFLLWKEIVILIVTVSVPLLATVYMWKTDKQKERAFELYKRKEEKYSKLLEYLDAFYSDTEDFNKRTTFVQEYRLIYLYCPDEVIRKGNTFLNMVNAKSIKKYSDFEKENAVQEFVLSLRNDLLSSLNNEDSKLRPNEFQIITANQK
jgi:hypothetical protein